MSEFTLEQVILIWIVGFGTLSYLSRKRVAEVFLKSRLPRIVNYYIILTPLVLVEEYLTCEIQPYLSCIQVTLIAFYILFILPYFIQRFIKLSYARTSILFGLIGWVNEFLVVGRIYKLPVPITILFSVLVVPIYGVLAILPSYYLERTMKE